MFKGIFLGEFGNVSHLKGEFEIDDKDLENVNIILAIYDTPSYEGYAFVLFEKDNKLYEVSGSHCSCYGLEGQWNPEEVDVKELINRIEKTKGTLRLIPENTKTNLIEFLSNRLPN